MNYITMEIRITRGQSLEAGNTYLVSASEVMHRGSANPAQTMFTISSDTEQRLNEILIDSKLRAREAPEEPAARAKEFGMKLFNYLFNSDVEKLYYEIKTRAMRQRSVIRLHLLIRPAELSTVPWELLHDDDQYLCLNSSPKILLARIPDIGVKKKSLVYRPPLRLLGITASPNGHRKLDVESEKQYIDEALKSLKQEKRVEIEWKKAEPSVISDLKSDGPWHVLHFIGHGYFENEKNREHSEGILIFEDSDGNRLDYDANRLRLALHENIQLVFLNACDTARGDPLDYLSSFAYKLAIKGIPAIVAMQVKISDDAAIQFARVFYESLASGDAVDEAVTKARHRIYVRADANSLEWIAPILYTSTSSGHLFTDANAVTRKSSNRQQPQSQDSGHAVEPSQPLVQAITSVDKPLPHLLSSQGQSQDSGQSVKSNQPSGQSTTVDDNSPPDQPSNQGQAQASDQPLEQALTVDDNSPPDPLSSQNQPKPLDQSATLAQPLEQNAPPINNPLLGQKPITPVSPPPPKRRFRPLYLVAVGLLLLATLSGVFLLTRPPSIASPTTFCLATDLPTSGPAGTTGQDIQKGVELAVMQSPLSTTYHGYDLKELYMDDTSLQAGGPDPKTGVKNLQNLFQQTACPNPIAIIGPYDSPTAVAEIPLAAQNHILLLSPSNTAACLTQQKFSDPSTCNYASIHPQGLSKTYARLPGTTAVEGYVAADFLLVAPIPTNPGQGGLGAQKIEVVGDEEVYGTQVSQAVIEELQNKGVKPIGIDCIKPTDDYKTDHSCSQLSRNTEAFSMDNIAALATKIRDEHPDAIFFGGRHDRGAGLLRKQLGELGLDQIPFVGGGGLVANEEAFFNTIGSHAVNVYATFPAADPSTFTSGESATFSKEYQKEFGKSPEGYSANGYDAANIVLQVIKALIDEGKPVTRESVAQGVLSGDFTGVAGNTIRFDQNGDNIGKRVYTIYQSQQSQGTWDWKVLAQRVV
jgi:ABC-type branched-subunit amino acid transport system substrate-binding protein